MSSMKDKKTMNAVTINPPVEKMVADEVHRGVGRPLTALPKRALRGEWWGLRIATQIRAARLKLFLTQFECCEKTKWMVSQYQWHQVESGHEPKLSVLARMCRVLGISLRQIVCEDK